ncbi:endonuclease [Chryseobacterium aquaeductus]|nr:endonuclease [Chryseobacterium aquaeductus]
MKKILLPVLFITLFVNAQIPAGYYNGTAGLAGYALKTKLHDIISEKNVNWHYGDLPSFYNQTDLDTYYDHGIANTTFLLDLYSENPLGTDAYEYISSQIVSGSSAEGLGYNREHIMPQSTFYSNYPMYSDLFFVIPTDARINQLRSNYPYGISNSTIHYTFTNTSKIGNNGTSGMTYTGRVYEPINEFKGDIARSLLYFAVRYESKLRTFKYDTTTNPVTDRNQLDGTEERAFDLPYIQMLKQWNILDPVSQKEIDRNNAVYTIQKNRNPFIDHPEWINLIWSENPDATPPLAPISLVSNQQNAHFIHLSWNPTTDTDILGYRIYMNGSATPIATTKSTSIVIDHLSPSTSYSFTVRAFDKGYLESSDSNSITVSTTAADTNSKDLMIVKYIEGSGNNKAIEIVNKTGHEINLNNYRLNIQFYDSVYDNYYLGNSFELEGKIDNNQSFVILNPKATLSCYTNSDAKFLTASDPMIFSGTQYVELAYNSTTIDAVGLKFNQNTNADISLYRKSTITQPSAIFSSTEWDSYAANYCQNLGSLSVYENIFSETEEFKIYPNPANDFIFVKGNTQNIERAQIIDLSGKIIYTEKKPFIKKKNISIQNLNTGNYLLELDGKTYPFIKR